MVKSEFSEQVIGEKEGVFIMKKIKYSNAPRDVSEAIKQSEIIQDFLPLPDELVFKEDNIKVTLELSKRSVTLFKRYAKKKEFKYQRLLRNLVDLYAEKKLRE